VAGRQAKRVRMTKEVRRKLIKSDARIFRYPVTDWRSVEEERETEDAVRITTDGDISLRLNGDSK
jgi:hypothetical protein